MDNTLGMAVLKALQKLPEEVSRYRLFQLVVRGGYVIEELASLREL